MKHCPQCGNPIKWERGVVYPNIYKEIWQEVPKDFPDIPMLVRFEDGGRVFAAGPHNLLEKHWKGFEIEYKRICRIKEFYFVKN